MRMPRRRTARRRVAVVAVTVMLLAGSVLVHPLGLTPRTSLAAWADTEVARSSTLTGGSVTAVSTMTCTPGGALAPTRFTWTAPTGGLTRSGYRWTVTGGLIGSGTLAANATFVDLPTGLLGIGSGTFSLYAVGPGGWESPAKTGTLAYLTAILASCSVP